MRSTINFIPIDYDYFDFEGKNYAKIIGRTVEGKRACVIDSCDIYFWAILHKDVSEKQIKKLQEKIEKLKVEKESRTCSVIKTEIHEKNFLGEPRKAIKIFITNYKDAHSIADQMDFKEVDKRREYDIDFITKYILEKKLKPLNWYKIEGEILNNSPEFGGIDSCLEINICLKAEKIQELEKHPEFKPRILAYDIEADEFDIGKGEIVMISLVGENFRKVLSWKKPSSHSYVEKLRDEAEMLEKFVKYVKEYSPDILVGYFSDGFDLPYLRARAEKNHVKLSLGLDNSQPSFSRGRLLTSRIKGIVHIDLFRFIKTVYGPYLQSETLSLNDVSNELLGEKKVYFEFKHSSKLNKEEWEKYFEYNLQDSILAYRLAEKILPDLVEFSKIIGQPIFDTARDSMSAHVEKYIINNLEKFNEIVEKKPISEIGERRAEERYEGAFVLQPKPGLYEDIVFFDFTSMYASVIVSFNLSLSTFRERKIHESTEVEIIEGEKIYFIKKPGFFPEILREIIEKRKKYKKEYNERKDAISKARSNAFKLLANAAYGYQGFFGARYYCREAAASTAALARKYIKETIKNIEKAGYKVVYSDSVDGKTKIILRKDGKVYEEEIENLFQKVDKKSFLGKEYNFIKNIEALTLDENGNSVFKPIVYIMRHKCNKKMYKINFTNNWSIEITEDHSLIAYQSEHFNKCWINKKEPLRRVIEIKPDEIKKKASSIIALKKIPYKNEESKNYPQEVYEFMGYFVGDGSFMRNKQNNKHNKNYYLRLSLGDDKDEIFNKIIIPLKEKEYIKNHWWSNTRKGDLTVNGLKLVKIISKDFKDKNGKKIIPEWFFEEKEENISAFLRGLFSADGCVMVRNNAPIIKLTSVYDKYIEEVRRLLYRVGISHSVFRENSINKYKSKNKIYSSGSQSKNIIIKNKEDFVKKIGFLLERKNKLASIKTKNIQKKSIKNFDFDIQSAKEIEEIKAPEYVYDIEIEDNHRFFANYVLVHNTDSICFERDKKSKKEILELLEKINNKLPGIMELDLEDFYKRGIWVTKRTGDFGAKKKYALINEEDKLKIRGFETVRRDWCDLARETQNKVLEYILKDGNDKRALEYVKNIIKKIKNRQIPLKELMIKTQLKKPIEEYKSESPHVTIAKKMRDRNLRLEIGMLMEYFIAEPESYQKTKTGKAKGLIRERAKLLDEKGEYDINYYLHNQILPAVENILEVFNLNTREILDGKKQTKLGDF